jgi:hypothetical protein
MKISQAILYFLVFTVILAIPPLLLHYTGNTGLLTPNFWVLFFFIAGLTFLVVIMMLFVAQQNSEYFAQAFLGGTTFKILVCLIFIFVFSRNNTPDKPVFLANFAYIYLLNMAFEVYVLLRKLRHENLG